MNPTTYSKQALMTATRAGDINDMLHAALGIGGEGGEIVDVTKKAYFYGRKIDAEDMLLELGDLAWYMNLMLAYFGYTWEEMFEANIKKLAKRYPEGFFDPERAINKDSGAEREAAFGA